jgi:hypothetical protein
VNDYHHPDRPADQPPAEEIDWAALVAEYRADPQGGTASTIVEALMLRIQRLARAYGSLPTNVSREDVEQQLTLEVLIGAAGMRLPSDAQWIPRRLVLRARTYVGRWLRAEARELGLPLELVENAAFSRDPQQTQARLARSPRRRTAVPDLGPRISHVQTTEIPRTGSAPTPGRVWIKKVVPNTGRRP